MAAIYSSVRRSAPAVAHTKPIPSEAIAALVQLGLDTSDQVVLDSCIMSLLMYAALLRISEVVAISWSDMVTEDVDVTLRIPRAKNDQLSEGRSTVMSLPDGSDSARLWDLWSSKRSKAGFLFKGRKPGTHISTSTASSRIQKLLNHLGLQHFSSHSFRAGAATSEVANGVPLECVRRRGRWNSMEGMASYITDSKAAQGGATPLP